VPLADHMMAARTNADDARGEPSVAKSQLSRLVCGTKRPRFRRVGDRQAAEHWPHVCLPGVGFLKFETTTVRAASCAFKWPATHERAATHERPTAYDVASTHERAATDEAGALHRRKVYEPPGMSYLNLVAQPTEPRWSWWGRVIFYVADVDAVYERALAAGCQPTTAPRDAEWGERFFRLIDPDGHELSFARPLLSSA
jgi:predicted enzyme related to lactoylglutathione lyase